MIKRTVEISRQPSHIATRDEQLLVLRKLNQPRPLPAHPPNLAGSVPCEDLGVLMVDERDTTYSHSALVKLAEYGCALVVCGREHLPVGMFLPISQNTELLARLDAQLSASQPTLKRLWKDVVRAKIRAQAGALAGVDGAGPTREKLLTLVARVRSGDPDNAEAQAAALYWPEIFRAQTLVMHPFRRRAGDLEAKPPNNLLDYGYAALRAAVARSLVSAGLLPALGIKHRGRSNPFCLADDLVEPLRPMIDVRVQSLVRSAQMTLDQRAKAALLSVLTDEVECGGQRGPLLVALTRYVASVVGVFMGESKTPFFPVPAASRYGRSTEPNDQAGWEDPSDGPAAGHLEHPKSDGDIP